MTCTVPAFDGPCGAILQLAEHHENTTSFSAASVEKIPDGRNLVNALTFSGETNSGSTVKRWIQCRLGHHVMDLDLSDVIKWS